MHMRKRGVCLVVECYISRSKFAIFCGRMNSLHCHKNDSPENEKAAEVCSTDATEVASLTHPGLLLQHHKLLCNPNRKCKFRNKKQQRCCTFLTALFASGNWQVTWDCCQQRCKLRGAQASLIQKLHQTWTFLWPFYKRASMCCKMLHLRRFCSSCNFLALLLALMFKASAMANVASLS